MKKNIRRQKLMTVEESRERISLNKSQKKRIFQDRKEIKDIIEGGDNRLLMIVGPCSAWPEGAVRVYAEQLAELAKLYKDDIKIVMRVYTQKPRTTVGWAGVALQPDPFGKPDVNAGIIYVRKMMREIIDLGLPIADEILFTNLFESGSDMLAWAAIGARSSEDQEHRAFASDAEFAVGMKNPTSGNIKIGINGVVSAQSEHVYVRRSNQIISTGNKYAHLVLRGGIEGSNYSMSHLKQVIQLYKKYNIKNPSVIVDASHDNIRIDDAEDYMMQSRTVMDVLHSCEKNKEVKKMMKGFLIESFVKEGNQDLNQINEQEIDLGGLSITDACIGINETRLLMEKIVQFRKNN